MNINTTFDMNPVDDIKRLTDIIFSKSWNMSYLSSFFTGLRVDEQISRFPNVSLLPPHFNGSSHKPDSFGAPINKTNKICEYLDAESADHESDLKTFDFQFDLCIGGYATLIVACLGLVFNASGIYHLSRREGYTNIRNILQIIKLILATAFLGLQINRSLDKHFLSFSNPPSVTYYILTNSGERFTYIASELTLIALSHSTYNAITRPFQGRQITLFWSIRKIQLVRYMLPIICLSILFTIPIIFEVDTDTICSCHGETTYVIPSEIRLNIYYSIFLIGVLKLGLLGVFPFFTLFYFAYHIRESFDNRLISNEGHYLVNRLQKMHRNNDIKTKISFWIVFTLMLTIFHFCGLNILIISMPFLWVLLYFTVHTKNFLNQRFIYTLSKAKVDTLNVKGGEVNTTKVSKTILFTIISFLLLNSLRLVTHVGELMVLLRKNKTSDHELPHDVGMVIYSDGILTIPKWLSIVVTLSNICMVIDASTNYLIHLYLNSTKRSNFTSFHTLCCLKS